MVAVASDTDTDARDRRSIAEVRAVVSLFLLGAGKRLGANSDAVARRAPFGTLGGCFVTPLDASVSPWVCGTGKFGPSCSMPKS